MSKGKDKFIVNGKDYKEYFPTTTLQYKIMQPFDLTSNTGKYDLSVNVYGGGTTGQAEAIRLAVSRALCELSEDNKSALKSVGLLTRDPRMVERKKFGQKRLEKNSNSLKDNRVFGFKFIIITLSNFVKSKFSLASKLPYMVRC